MLYGDNTTTVERIAKKHTRQKRYGEKYLADFDREYMFWSGKRRGIRTLDVSRILSASATNYTRTINSSVERRYFGRTLSVDDR